MQTPRRTNIRPSLAKPGINTASTPQLSSAARTALDRKASLHALTAGGSPVTRTPGANGGMHAAGDGGPLAVGDHVDVPGGMYGVVKFVGGVNGKKGTFVGVELAREYAARGKNDGDVDGTHYFHTSVPGSGIFLPSHRATKRASIADSSESFPATPSTPGATFDYGGTSPTPPMPKFSQSVGPGTHGASPQGKRMVRPSLSRPGSPVKSKPSLTPTPKMPTPGRNMSGFSKSTVGPSRGVTPSPMPNRTIGGRTPQPPKSPSRSGSRTEEEQDLASVSALSEADRSISGAMSNRGADEEVMRLQRALAERDKQLLEQAHSLAEMESSLQEIQSLLPTDGSEISRSSQGGEMDADAAHLRALLREKNEKISMLTAEFDMHRADFRSTIDTLEMASSETQRVYEQRIDDLMAEIRELQEQTEDVESVAEQLKQLEELVQELEEGLEDARRGEAEARGEVEFLRGEVERGRSELRREREKAAQALKDAQALDSGSSSREMEQRDDEIRGLKAIIHSLSSGGGVQSPKLDKRSSLDGPSEAEMTELRTSLERMEREKEELRGLIERKSFREEELEREVERLRTEATLSGGEAARDSVISNKTNDHATPRDSKSTIVSWRGYQKQQQQHERNGSEVNKLTPMAESEHDDRASSPGGASELWCEICETGGHDILNCTNDLGGAGKKASFGGAINEHHNELHLAADMSEDTDIASSVADDIIQNMEKMSLNRSHDAPAPLSSSLGSPSPAPKAAAPPPAAPAPAPPTSSALPNPYEEGLVAGKGQDVDADKWCALCERDGHDATACPFEDML
ncbi:cap-gly domain-containing protein [Diplodia corticola]|uniref:Cap-gly domain-containing protein n=1 Tax=Diplodia corticola TaxID=236234 RepID=A0A1J9QXW9_9PEZI|nr:cap-gly domain-containing protein [Diplodia corticola]OJD33878.1 cap-gly domain-containing protein [Diplodia corticola]